MIKEEEIKIKLSISGILSLLVTITVTFGSVSHINTKSLEPVNFGNIVTDQMQLDTPVEKNLDVKIKHLSDEEVRERVEKLWGREARVLFCRDIRCDYF